MMHCRSSGFRPDSFSPRITSVRASGGESFGPHFCWLAFGLQQQLQGMLKILAGMLKIRSLRSFQTKTKKVHTQLIVGKV